MELLIFIIDSFPTQQTIYNKILMSTVADFILDLAKIEKNYSFFQPYFPSLLASIKHGFHRDLTPALRTLFETGKKLTPPY